MFKKTVTLLLLMSLTLCGCSAKNIQAYVEEKKKFKDVHVSNREEMADFGKKVLEERYGCEFVIEEDEQYFTDSDTSRFTANAH